MSYKGYIGQVEFDDEAGVLYGEVLNLRDVITCQGESVEALRQAMRDSVEDYLAFCAERGEEPERPFSGKFATRVAPELHRKLYVHAKQDHQSLNGWVNDLLERAVA